MQNYVDYIKEFIEETLPEYEGTCLYACDLGYKLTEKINTNGTATFNRAEAIKYIKEWFDEAAEVYNYQVENYGEACQNPFENPEAWMVCMIIEGVNSVLSQCSLIDEQWNEEGFELTKENIQTIIDYVKEVESIEF